MRALRRFSVRAQLPAALAPLQDLATNLRWTWHGPTQDLFATVDENIWRATGDPTRLLGEVAPGRLTELAEDGGFVQRVSDLAADLRTYLTAPHWYQQRERDRPAAVGYFSMEFGVSEVLPNYSGGLGILAGDHLKAASDLGVPLVAVGLLYRSGYFRQSLSLDGWQQEQYPALDPQGLPLRLLTTPDGAPEIVSVAMPGGRELHARVWVAAVGRVPLLLLDTDIAENDADLRGVTDRLYGGDAEHRIRQEILIGIGGVRAVRAYCAVTGHPTPEVFHTNEGHAGFLGLERMRELVSGAGLDEAAALATVRAGTVFTTHTPVPAGIDRFPIGLVEHYFTDALLPGLDRGRLLALGREQSGDMFNMAYMGLRLAQRSNGVSQLHGSVSREMFRELWGGFDVPEVPIGSVTNGVHGATWTAREIGALTSSTSPGSGSPGHGTAATTGGPELFGVTDALLWELRGTLRSRLVTEVRRRVRRSWLDRGASAPELGWTERIFDPDVLTVGFARRVPTYKRLTLMLRDQERLKALLLDPERPVQLVIAGKSHPADEAGKRLIQEMVRFADDPAVRHRIAFLPDYDMSMARYLYWGCDVWLNNPLRPLEACGTSGMKSALNGGLNLSVRDGWWDELYDGRNGWAIPTADGVGDPDRRDDIEAGALYDLLSAQVAPLFYDRGADGVPDRWTSLVRHTLATLSPKVQASRMVADYVNDWYVPAARAAARVSADGYAGARELAAYRARLDERWPHVRVAQVDVSGLGDTPVLGARMDVHAEIDLAGLDPSEVLVQVVVGRADEADELTGSVVEAMSPVGPGQPTAFSASVALPAAGVLGYTVRVLPRHDLLAAPAELGRVVLPA